MSSFLPNVHPHLQRYLPGQLPKRQKRVIVGETNAREFESSLSSTVDRNIVRRLGLPDKLVQTMVPSITVTRATNTARSLRSGESFLDTSAAPFQSTESYNTQAGTDSYDASKCKGGRTATGSHQVTIDSLIKSNNTGKDRGFTAETFYSGSRTIGGAGQQEFNNPKEQFGRNPTISAYQLRDHFSPTMWSPKVSTHADTSPFTKFAYERDPYAENGEGKSSSPACKTKPESEHCETRRECARSYTPKWVREYVPPNVCNVPPPKLRFELTDYHSTFHHTQPQPSVPHYVNERDRHVTINEVSLYTPTTAELRRPARRQIACPSTKCE